MNKVSYNDFLKSKVKLAEAWGFDIAPGALNPALKPHQGAATEWMVKGGRRALFGSFGLGKSVIQFETIRLTIEQAGGMGLIVLPLGVKQEFVRDAVKALDLQGQLPSGFMLLQPQSWSNEVWADITRMLTLNGAQASKGKEKHLCPLQFDIVDRAITQYTMRGETVYDPFGGLMTVPYRAIQKGRYGIGSELNPLYFLDGAAYCKAAEDEVCMPTLFDLEGLEERPRKSA